jgi:uncharacterized membrane protein YfcA
MTADLGLYLAFGCVSGILSGLLGIGGGIVIVPFLAWHFSRSGFPDSLVMIMAVATSLATIIVTSVSAAGAHLRRGAVDWAAVRTLTPGILLGAVAGSFIANLLPIRAFKLFFAGFLLVVAGRMLRQSGQATAMSAQAAGHAGFGWAGLIIGALSSALGIGGGSLSVPFLLRRGVPALEAVGISSACGFPIAVAGTAAYVALSWRLADLPPWSLGYVYLPALAGILLTSVAFAPVGAHFAHRWPTRRLRLALAGMVGLAGAKLLWQALH